MICSIYRGRCVGTRLASEVQTPLGQNFSYCCSVLRYTYLLYNWLSSLYSDLIDSSRQERRITRCTSRCCWKTRSYHSRSTRCWKSYDNKTKGKSRLWASILFVGVNDTLAPLSLSDCHSLNIVSRLWPCPLRDSPCTLTFHRRFVQLFRTIPPSLSWHSLLLSSLPLS